MSDTIKIGALVVVFFYLGRYVLNEIELYLINKRLGSYNDDDN